MNKLQGLNQLSPTSPSPVIGAQSSLATIDQLQPSISARASSSVFSEGDGLKAEYYDNRDFTNLKLTRTDATVNFDWGRSSPNPLITGADTFSVRWTGFVEAKYSETYNFYTTSDDGVRLWVNGQQIINRFVNQSATEYSGSIRLVEGQKYDIRLEYYENQYDAVAKLAWSSNTQTKEFIPQSQLYSAVNIASSGNGLKAEYYDNRDFTNLKLTRTDATVNFNWGRSSPDPSPTSPSRIGVDTFSVRWTGQVEAKYSETYNFYTTTDDGVRLWVNDQQIINRFVNQSATEYSGSIRLVEGQKYDIRLEYYENQYDAVAKLAWSSNTQTKEFIPQSQLYSQAIITLGSASTTVNESDGSVSITVLRGGDLSGISSVKYATIAGTATAGVDYGSEGTESAGTIIFAAGESSKQITIPILNDSLAEVDETFNFVVDQSEGANLGTQRTVGITIQDNDRSDLDFTQPIVNEGVGAAIVTVTRGNASAVASVNYITVDGTAKAGSDYQAQTVPKTLSFAVGEISKTISITLINDTIGEPNETFNLRFSNAVGVQLTTQETTISVIDNDPGNFVSETVASGLIEPTAFDWTPDNKRMFIAQKDGVVRVLNNGTLLSTPFIDISGQVNNTRDRGLLGMAVHPDFGQTANGKNYVYLLFTYDPVETNPNNPKNNPNTSLDNPDQRGNRTARLIRVTADPNNDYKTAIAGSEVVLLGKNSIWDNIVRPDSNSTNVNLNHAPSGILNRDTDKPFTSLEDYLNNLDKVQNIQDFIATDSESHSVGTVRFGTDGSLFVSLGDGTSYNGTDARAVRVQDVNSLSGKILRIDPITGAGLSSNPFYKTGDDLNSNRSKVYNLGLRNPFRFTIDERTNTPYIGDVGWYTWEEVNVGTPGANFGWPYYEGARNSAGNNFSRQQTKYRDLPSAQEFYNSGKPVTAPTYTYPHLGNSASIIVGDFYTGNTFPSIYKNALFVGDTSRGTIDALTLNSEGKVVSVRQFASSSEIPEIGVPVQISVGEDGNLYYANLISGEINRFRSV
ncbi:PA14 domain-containing protein [Nostoc sp.]|uniref:PA14 domain-containing protein n=1 Tax=Nostoc sp. TaxID=1180 RepID=UPI0035934CB6